VFCVADEEAVDPAVYGLATVGGFRMFARPGVDGLATLEFVASLEAGSAELCVFVEDGLGGSAGPGRGRSSSAERQTLSLRACARERKSAAGGRRAG